MKALGNADHGILASGYAVLAMVHQREKLDAAITEADSAIDFITNQGEIDWSRLDREGALVYALAQSIIGDVDAAKRALLRAIDLGDHEYYRIIRHLDDGAFQALADDPTIRRRVASIRPAEML